MVDKPLKLNKILDLYVFNVVTCLLMRFIITLITSLILLLPASGQGQWEIVDVEIDSVVLNLDGGKSFVFLPNKLTEVQFINRDI